MMESLIFLPFAVVLLLLANYAEKNRSLSIVVKILLIFSSALLITLGYLSLIVTPEITAVSAETSQASGLSLIIMGALPLLTLSKRIRSVFSRYIDIDPDSPLHMFALYASFAIISFSIIFMLTIDISEFLKSVEIDYGPVVASGIIYIIIGFLGVGLFIRRDFRECLKRLGILKPSFKEISYAIALTFLLLLIVVIIGIIVNALGIEGLDKYDEDLVGLFGGSITLIMALAISLSSGIGEEIIFRGALQPRFGIIFTALVFTITHVQYPSILALSVVFAAGLVLGWERKRFNTTTAMITHSLFNFIQLSILSLA